VALEIVHTQSGARINGELDMATAPQLKDFLSYESPTGRFELDLSGLSFMDSSGLEVLLRHAATRSDDAPLVVRNPTRPVLRVFEIAVPGGVDGLELETEHEAESVG
jgi:anti-anti-sigma factor